MSKVPQMPAIITEDANKYEPTGHVFACVCSIRALSAYKHVCGFFPVWNMNKVPRETQGL